MKTYYGVTRISQVFEMIEDVCEDMKGPNENLEATKELMICTAAQETHLGKLKDPTTYRAGAGVMQVDPIGITDIKQRGGKWIEFCREKWDVHFERIEHRELNEAPLLSIIAARLRYKVVPDPIPSDSNEIWKYYKRWYNSYAGSATQGEYMKNRKWAMELYRKWKSGEKL
jgi:hypothetical protein